MNTISDFKNDLWNGIYNHSKKLLVPTFIVTIIYFVLVMGITVAIFLSFFNMETFREMSQASSSNPFDTESVLKQSRYFEEMISTIGPSIFFAAFGFIYLFLLLVMAWFTNIMLKLNQEQVLTGETNIGESLKHSFDVDWLKLVLLYVLILIFGSLLMVATAALATISVGISFLAFLASWILMNRFLASPGAIVHGSLSIPAAVSFSFSNITFKRGAKAALVQVVVIILLFLAMLLIAATSSILGSFGAVLAVILQIVFAIAIYSLLFSSLSAAFFRYADVEVEADETSHLLDDI